MRWNGASRCELVGKSMETETTTWSEFPNGEKAIVEQIIASEERNKSKRRGCNPSRKVNHLSKVVWDRKIITEFTRSISSTRIGKPVLMIDVSLYEVSKDKNISRRVDRENLIYVGWNRIQKCTQRRSSWLIEEKEVRQSEVKPVGNISKNLQSFLKINCMQQKVVL